MVNYLISQRFVLFVHKVVERLDEMLCLRLVSQCPAHSTGTKHGNCSFSKDFSPVILQYMWNSAPDTGAGGTNTPVLCALEFLV